MILKKQKKKGVIWIQVIQRAEAVDYVHKDECILVEFKELLMLWCLKRMQVWMNYKAELTNSSLAIKKIVIISLAQNYS